MNIRICIPVRYVYEHTYLYTCLGSYIKENAYIVIRLLLRHSECIDPIINNDNGLSEIFCKCTEEYMSTSFSTDRRGMANSMSPEPEGSDDDDRSSKLSSDFGSVRSRQALVRRSTTMSSLQTMDMSSFSELSIASGSEEATLRFLAKLLRLLGYCCPESEDLDDVAGLPNIEKQTGNRKLIRQNANTDSQVQLSTGQKGVVTLAGESAAATSQQMSVTIAEHTRALLRSLIEKEDIFKVLTLKLSEEHWKRFDPAHKIAALLFFERVHGISNMLNFIEDVVTPDVKFAVEQYKVDLYVSTHCVVSLNLHQQGYYYYYYYKDVSFYL